jgi:hypothetical protein
MTYPAPPAFPVDITLGVGLRDVYSSHGKLLDHRPVDQRLWLSVLAAQYFPARELDEYAQRGDGDI